MSGSSGFGQLVKGIVIGIVLILAIVGSMSILDKKKDTNASNSVANTASNTPANSIPAPSINVASSTVDPATTTDTPPANTSPETNTEAQEPAPTPVETFKPVLENEKAVEIEPEIATPEVKKPEPIQYGQLKLASIDFETKNSLKASFEVFDTNNKKVGESANTDDASFRLPAGRYKVITTLSTSKGSERKIKPVQSTQFVNIRANSISQKVFKMEPPVTIGVLQVSAKNAKDNKTIRASYLIQKENGDTVASRQNVANTLFKLKAGSYKVTVKSGANTDFRTVVIEPGESTKEVFTLQEANIQGKLLVRVFDTSSNQPLLADIVIISNKGKVVQELKAISKTELSLLQGNYTIRVTGPNGQSSKKINIVGGRANSEVFRFNAPVEAPSNEVQITDNVRITPPRDPAATSPDATVPEETATNESAVPATGKLQLVALSGNSQSSLKSNFYIQTLSGKNIDKKVYAGSAVFDLKPGIYKVTVRSKDMINSVKTIQVVAGKEIREIFSLKKVNKTQPASPRQTSSTNNRNTRSIPSPTTPALGGVKPTKKNAIPNGFLNVSMQPPRNTHFVITTQAGKKVVELTSVPNGNFKLDTGTYNVTAILNNQRRSKTTRVRAGKTVRLSFNPADFQAKTRPRNTNIGGILRSRIVNKAGQPIKGDITVTDLRGRVIARANGVSVGVFNLPAKAHTVIVNYRGLRGTESVNIVAGETTIQTFTIVAP